MVSLNEPVYHDGLTDHDIDAIVARLFSREPQRSCVLSLDAVYRYLLWETWGPGDPELFLLINPSTATHVTDDNTFLKVRKFAKTWGAGGVVIANLYPFRSTDPMGLRPAQEAGTLGTTQNLRYLSALASRFQTATVGWGKHPFTSKGAGSHNLAVASVMETLASAGVQMRCFVENLDRSPKHPLYVKDSAVTVPWPAPLSPKE